MRGQVGQGAVGTLTRMVTGESQRLMDEAWAWVAAAEQECSRRIDEGSVGPALFLLGDCGDVLATLEEAGAQPQAVHLKIAADDVGGGTAGERVAPALCLARAEAALDAIAADDRSTLLLPARAELRAVVVRQPVDDRGQ